MFNTNSNNNLKYFINSGHYNYFNNIDFYENHIWLFKEGKIFTIDTNDTNSIYYGDILSDREYDKLYKENQKKETNEAEKHFKFLFLNGDNSEYFVNNSLK